MIDLLLKKYQDLKDMRTASLVARGILFIFNDLRAADVSPQDTYREQLIAVAQAIAHNGSLTESGVLILLDVLEGVTSTKELSGLSTTSRAIVLNLLKQALHTSIKTISSTNTMGLTIAQVCIPF